MTDYDGMSWTERTAALPNGRRLVESGYELVGVGIHRDSHPFEVSNMVAAAAWLGLDDAYEPGTGAHDIGRPWEVHPDDAGHDLYYFPARGRVECSACGYVQRHAGPMPPCPDTFPPVAVAHFRHWAVGWVDELIYRPSDADAAAIVRELRERLEEYPLLNEDDAYRREWETDHPSPSECYSDEGDDCPCDWRRLGALVEHATKWAAARGHTVDVDYSQDGRTADLMCERCELSGVATLDERTAEPLPGVPWERPRYDIGGAVFASDCPEGGDDE